MTIQAIIFDIGGVLLRTTDRSHRQKWEAQLGLAPGMADEIVFNGEQGHRAQRGEVTIEDHWQDIGRRLQLDALALAAFRQDFWAGDELDMALVDFIRKLRNGYQTAVISNAFTDLRTVLTEEFAIADAFDLLTISAEEGIMKPDPRIFQRTLQKLGRQPQETVFIDDFAHNVQGARDVGMAAIHFQPGLDLAAALADLGVTI